MQCKINVADRLMDERMNHQIRNADAEIKTNMQEIMSVKEARLLVLLHKFHKCLFVHEASVVAVVKHTEISETELGKALVNQVDGRMHVKGNGGLL